MTEDIAEVIDEFRTDIMPKVRASIKAHVAEYPDDFKRQARVDYLKGRMEGLVEKALHLMDDYDGLLKGDDIDSRLYVGGLLLGTIKTISALQGEIISLKKSEQNKGDITEDDIRKAREFPFDQLVDINRNKMARCIFHQDRNPSFSIKGNKGKCFGCGWTGDTIAFVMERDGLSFPEAVRSLQ